MCGFKFKDKNSYGYCGEKIKKIAFIVDLGASYRLTHHLPYANKAIYDSLKSIDDQVDEYKYDISVLSSKEMIEPKNTDYFVYVHIDNPNFNSKTMRVSIFKSIHGKFDYVFDDLPVDAEDFYSFFYKNVELIAEEINFEIFYKKA